MGISRYYLIKIDESKPDPPVTPLPVAKLIMKLTPTKDTKATINPAQA